MNNRKPTWNYILNDIAFSSLLVECLYSEYSSSQDKYDLEYQIRLMQEKEDKLQEENKQLKDKIDKAIEYIKEELYEVGGCIHGSDLPHSAIEPILEILGDKE